jgi:peroxiredoxin
MKAFLFAAACAAIATFGLPAQQPGQTPLKTGDPAPDFTVTGRMNTSGKDIRLADFRGKKIVVLAFFPAAFTGG